MSDQQPEALRLADEVDEVAQTYPDMAEVSAELRRLHAENENLRMTLRVEEACSFRTQMQQYAAEVEDYKATNDVLMRQTSEQIGEIVALKELNRELLVALQACDEAMSYMSEYDIPLHLPFRVKAAIANATGAAA